MLYWFWGNKYKKYKDMMGKITDLIKDKISNRINRFNFEYGAKIVLYIIVGFLPLFFLPFGVGVEFGREIAFGVLIILAAILWLFEVLTRGRLHYQHSLVLWASALLFIIFSLSSLFSVASWYSTVLGDVSAEKLSVLFLAIVLMILTGSVFRSKHDVGLALLILIFAGGVSALFSTLQLLFGVSLYGYMASFAANADFNVVGTRNSLALFYAALLAMGTGLVTSSWLMAIKKWMRWAFFSSLVLLFANLVLINFRISWILLLGSSLFLFGLMFRRRGEILATGGENSGGEIEAGKKSGPAPLRVASLAEFGWRYWLALVLIATSGFMIFVRSPLFSKIAISSEVSPSFHATWNIGRDVFKGGTKSILFGSGLGTFGLDWSRYKNPAINQTQFWGVRFNQGFSWLATLMATTGVLGVLVFVLFLGLSVFLFLRGILLLPVHDTELASSVFVGLVGAIITAVLYPANFTLMIFLFMSIGFLSLLLTRRTPEGIVPQESGEAIIVPVSTSSKLLSGEIAEQNIVFTNQWAVFLSSLLAVFFISLSVGWLYYEWGRLREALAQQQGSSAFVVGSMDTALASFERAALLQPRNFRNYQVLVQLRTEKIRNLVQRATVGENVQQEFQATVNAANQNSQMALELMPSEPILWRTQGILYEVMIPFINGSERLAFDSYKRATELEPVNPSLWTDWGRAGLVFADRLLLLANQASGKDREGFLQARINTLREVAVVFQKAIAVKGDFAPAHFLLSQTAIRLGDLKSAIQATENTKITAPFDIGVAFQLGLLYYQAGDFVRSQAELERAISINENYSNARYFLGLIYDQRQDKTRALEQFHKIAAFNQDNQEVRLILQNLRSGKPALEGIVPPAPPPAQRIEPPVQERGEGGR